MAARANVAGDRILYCAESAETAFAERRAKPGEYFTLAMLRPCSMLRLVNVVGRRALGPDDPFALIDRWMSHPVADRDQIVHVWPPGPEADHYYSTQFFSSIVRAEGYDGICFSSSVHPAGLNFALFNPYSVDIIDRRLVRFRG